MFGKDDAGMMRYILTTNHAIGYSASDAQPPQHGFRPDRDDAIAGDWLERECEDGKQAEN